MGTSTRLASLPSTERWRRLPIGAERTPEGGVHFRVWAPRASRVDAAIEEGPIVALASEGNGYFSGTLAPAATRDVCLYRYRLDGGEPVPDPASRFQPEGPHGPSQVVDASRFRWTDERWRGLRRDGQVFYEMHVGTFTREGTWAAALRELPELRSLGVTVVELMPVSEFSGRFGWGYDGVDLFAPTHLYGTPDDLREFVDRAHAVGLGVVLDVVYNHFGPDGCYVDRFSEDYFTDRYANEWGRALNFDGENSGPVREFFVANAGYWIDEYHLDGLRLDATQSIYDASPVHVLREIEQRVRDAAGSRSTLIVGENEPQHVHLVRPREEGGYGLDALWNDDFHHSAMVALTGRNEAYYTDHRGTPQELVSAAKWGYLFQGQRYLWQGKPRGTPAFGVPPAAFVLFTQNHDQVANSGRGERVHQLTSPGRHRAMTALLLLAPGTPLLFQGQEFSASSPFLYFADMPPDIATLVREGRSKFLAQFQSLAVPEMQACLADPSDEATFERCKLDLSERTKNAEIYALHRDLLALRRDDPVFRAQRLGGVDGAVLGPHAFVLRFFGGGGDDRLLLVNFGLNFALEPAPEPLLAPPEGKIWRVLLTTEGPNYGGCGVPPPHADRPLWVTGEAALVLSPTDANDDELQRDPRPGP